MQVPLRWCNGTCGWGGSGLAYFFPAMPKMMKMKAESPMTKG